MNDRLWNGTMHYSTGEKANYFNGKLNGPGTYYNSDGDRYEGIFVEDQLWNGTLLYASGETLNYLNGKINRLGSFEASNQERDEETSLDSSSRNGTSSATASGDVAPS